MKGKFLTVYAVFDADTQSSLKDWQDKITESGLVGSQTEGIPYHISLGSFATDCETKLQDRLQDICSRFEPFEIELNSIQTFGNRVLYLKPIESFNLMELHNAFNGNYADGLPYVPHSTMYIGDDAEVERAKAILLSCFKPICATVTAIHLSEFFPMRFIASYKLEKRD